MSRITLGITAIGSCILEKYHARSLITITEKYSGFYRRLITLINVILAHDGHITMLRILMDGDVWYFSWCNGTNISRIFSTKYYYLSYHIYRECVSSIALFKVVNAMNFNGKRWGIVISPRLSQHRCYLFRWHTSSIRLHYYHSIRDAISFRRTHKAARWAFPVCSRARRVLFRYVVTTWLRRWYAFESESREKSEAQFPARASPDSWDTLMRCWYYRRLIWYRRIDRI